LGEGGAAAAGFDLERWAALCRDLEDVTAVTDGPARATALPVHAEYRPGGSGKVDGGVSVGGSGGRDGGGGGGGGTGGGGASASGGSAGGSVLAVGAGGEDVVLSVELQVVPPPLAVGRHAFAPRFRARQYGWWLVVGEAGHGGELLAAKRIGLHSGSARHELSVAAPAQRGACEWELLVVSDTIAGLDVTRTIRVTAS
jgi:hypothetical protein